jgi:hypothetical protein
LATVLFTATAQELQQLHQRLLLTIPGRGTNALVPTPSALLITLDMHIAEINQDHTALPEPTVKRQCVSCFDVNDARSELMIDQRTNKRTKMALERSRSAADEGCGTLKCLFHDVLLAGGNARQGGSLCPAR